MKRRYAIRISIIAGMLAGIARARLRRRRQAMRLIRNRYRSCSPTPRLSPRYLGRRHDTRVLYPAALALLGDPRR